MNAKPKVIYQCEDCGSNDILWDAYAEWDADNQMLSLHSTYEDADKRCNSCEATLNGPKDIKEVPYNPEEVN